MEKAKAVISADLAADNRFEKWAGSGQQIEQPFEQTVDPSQLNFDFVKFDGKKFNADESCSSECSETSSECYGEIEDAIIVEMQTLENIFKNMGLNFRMIDRIGEGENGIGAFTPFTHITSSRNFLHCIQSGRHELRSLPKRLGC